MLTKCNRCIKNKQTHKFTRYLLSLDGGGIRGLFSAVVLAALEEDLGVRIVDHFDLIAGTSTGGILAIGLGLGLTPKQILEFYKEYGKTIFPWWRRKLPMGIVFGSRYSNAGLIRSLQDVYKDCRFGESTKRLLITSYSLDDDNVYFFRTAHHERLARDYKLEAWKVAAATSAAPGYFPAYSGIDSLRLIDGGMCANNPSMAAVTEAVGTLGCELSKISLFSVGTTGPRQKYPTRLNHGAKLAWAPQAPTVFLRAQAASAENQVKFFLSEDRYMRADFVTAGDGLGLDSVSSLDQLFAAGKVLSRKISPEFKRKFLNHQAQPFEPFHRLEK